MDTEKCIMHQRKASAGTLFYDGVAWVESVWVREGWGLAGVGEIW